MLPAKHLKEYQIPIHSSKSKTTSTTAENNNVKKK